MYIFKENLVPRRRGNGDLPSGTLTSPQMKRQTFCKASRPVSSSPFAFTLAHRS